MLDFIGMKQVCNNMFLFSDKNIGFTMKKVILEDIKKIDKNERKKEIWIESCEKSSSILKKIVFLISFIITKIVRTHETVGFMSSFFVLKYI